MIDSSRRGSEPPRRERLKRARAERILEAAAAVFARKGFHQATIREIAELADVAEGTIYNYFADKRDLLVAMTRHVIAQSASTALAQLQTDDEQAFLTAILAERFEFAHQNFDLLRALIAEVWTDEAFRRQYLSQVITPLLDLLEVYLRARIESGHLRPVNTHVIIRAMAGSFFIFLMLGEPGQGELDTQASRHEMAHELAEFFLYGLQARKDNWQCRADLGGSPFQQTFGLSRPAYGQIK
jgi:AcrR family transcriptional regulator